MGLIKPILIVLCCCMGGCANEEESAPVDTNPVKDLDHFLSDQHKALDKAKQVEQLLEDSVEKRGKLIDDMSR